jgi:hypothetical protein
VQNIIQNYTSSRVQNVISKAIIKRSSRAIVKQILLFKLTDWIFVKLGVNFKWVVVLLLII